MSEQWIVRGQYVRVRALEPIGNRAMQLLPLRIQHEVVCHVAGDDVFEDVGKIGIRSLLQGDVQRLQSARCLAQQVSIFLDGTDVRKDVGGENSTDDAGYFKRQLPLGGQAVDTTGDNALYRVGKVQAVQIPQPRIQHTLAVDNLDLLCVAQGVCDLLAEERIALHLVDDQRGNLLRQNIYTVPLADQVQSFLRCHRIQHHPVGSGRPVQPFVLAGHCNRQWTCGNHQQQRRDIRRHTLQQCRCSA